MNESTQGYRARVQQREITDAPVKQAMPEKVDTTVWEAPTAARISLFTVTLLLGLFTFVAFSVVQSASYLLARFEQAPTSTIVLAVLLSAFTLCLLWLCVREWRGFRAVNQHLSAHLNLPVLAEKKPQTIQKTLRQYAGTFSKHSFAAYQYRQFQHTVTDDMTSAELVRLYERMVMIPVNEKAQAVVKRESLTSGSLVFVSPNHLIQTFAIVWISLRTIRRVAQVYGLRPATAGNWKLLTIVAQNLAAQSIFDLTTDEIANQISGSLTARFVENSAEAVAAGALNVRLGKALIRLLN
ncbi:DUF697 domain-containing protein [Alteromonas lipotrueiana]|mgnify:CR=1 FL=1|uniref:DUF697 domain-containing protein n=1 Tax=Alteromonas lipotrueiana TaxID=2803815 RepID=UPI001C43950F|nr:DUF697 domain-containing protein [Alteromonas lipotrueiana]